MVMDQLTIMIEHRLPRWLVTEAGEGEIQIETKISMHEGGLHPVGCRGCGKLWQQRRGDPRVAARGNKANFVILAVFAEEGFLHHLRHSADLAPTSHAAISPVRLA